MECGCFNPFETLAIPFPLLWNLVLVPTHSENQKRMPSLASLTQILRERFLKPESDLGATREQFPPRIMLLEIAPGRERSGSTHGSALSERSLWECNSGVGAGGALAMITSTLVYI
jgi:hypothetical protein